jgi:ABC-type sugar transport system ATPase subunit
MKNVIRPAKENDIVEKIGSRIAIKWLGPEAPVNSLSGGNQQKLLVARWLLAESKFLVFDEPTRGIDVGAKKEVYTLLNELRILVMRRGRLVGNLTTRETCQEEVMHLAAVEETK